MVLRLLAQLWLPLEGGVGLLGGERGLCWQRSPPRLLHLLQLGHELPESALGHHRVGCEDLPGLERLCGQQHPNTLYSQSVLEAFMVLSMLAATNKKLFGLLNPSLIAMGNLLFRLSEICRPETIVPISSLQLPARR